MAYLFFLIALLVAFYLAWPVLQRANPSQIVRGGALVLLIVSGAVAVFALFTGRPQWVIAALVVGLFSLISRLATPATAAQGQGGGRRRWGRGGGESSIRTRYLNMSLDHGTGAVRGEVLAGQHEGRRVETMSTGELVDLLREAAVDDPQTAQLLEAYLDRVDPAWRADHDAPSGGGGGGAAGRIRMSREEALEVLGLGLDATDADVRAAHRKLMRQHHPDRGGDVTFAAKLNEAKEVLLGGR
jgi:hypothetical protein